MTAENGGGAVICQEMENKHLSFLITCDVVPVARLTADGEESQVQVREGGSVTFTCRVKANPTAYNVTWFHNVSR
ncbi:hypothetical protein Pmani_025172 [Petrolisthes manimaculis]|uniref:Ig-like domain-containing protein n=1 Tax=Petrolisthes manimaculis TaxID=1843537 RepID=A0AAE1TYL8_9EUCA|nr:hypothetical protein Pmani_025172 [Petrolisthes manimaculis]